MEHISISSESQKTVLSILEKDEWFKLHRVKFILQNSEDLSTILKTKIENIDGPVVVIGTDSERNDHPAVDVNISLNVTELVPTNRAIQGFATAIEVIEACIDDLDGKDWHWNEDLRHETPREQSGILVAHTTFQACVERPSIPGIDGDDLPPPNDG